MLTKHSLTIPQSTGKVPKDKFFPGLGEEGWDTDVKTSLIGHFMVDADMDKLLEHDHKCAHAGVVGELADKEFRDASVNGWKNKAQYGQELVKLCSVGEEFTKRCNVPVHSIATDSANVVGRNGRVEVGKECVRFFGVRAMIEERIPTFVHSYIILDDLWEFGGETLAKGDLVI